MNFKQWEGTETAPVTISVTNELLNKYLKATNGLAADSQFVPPAFPMIFYQFIKVPWLEQQSFIHKEQVFSYEHPISLGDSLQCTVSLISLEKRRRFLVLHQELIGKNDGNQVVFSAKSILLKEAE
ncbi:FAS1-like dehydratase domain-containing protein [Fictibacillus barbaricus]|uniref:FAS1-like dehydratase domain-containing protein n=1 Tax=Fictibacillus barbaricus TaxID=182136 RepID=A0ABU1U225_9BACL|nr:hypothetical protein [Fictibacillus barbaricus]MDR7073411.1 hypothetical protein [Fictibacillus barbaricus]